VKLTYHFHLVPRSKNVWICTSTPQYVFVAMCLVNHRDFTFTFAIKIYGRVELHFQAFLTSKMKMNNQFHFPVEQPLQYQVDTSPGYGSGLEVVAKRKRIPSLALLGIES
jgi:hypothetical protein